MCTYTQSVKQAKAIVAQQNITLDDIFRETNYQYDMIAYQEPYIYDSN